MKINLTTPIIVKVKIEGTLDFREIDVILDTGARYTAISWEVAKDIGYDPAISEKRVSIVTANGVIEVPLINVKSISLKELKVENVEVC
ncbi:MAG: retropepsin-like aspartic protease [bacterium]